MQGLTTGLSAQDLTQAAVPSFPDLYPLRSEEIDLACTAPGCGDHRISGRRVPARAPDRSVQRWQRLGRWHMAGIGHSWTAGLDQSRREQIAGL